ncbi:MAG: 3-phosphoshikimate 1-carboxyvinyltransferase [Nitrospirota bacterium]
MSLRGEITVPGDKSITHRALILSALSEKKTIIYGALDSEDCLRTKDALCAMGITIKESDAFNAFEVTGKGLDGLSEPSNVIDCGNSGTTLRLLAGLLSGRPFFSVLTGDDSLRKRPMRRVIDPLQRMGAHIVGRARDSFAPLAINGTKLSGIEYPLPVASAQVKSALLLAGLTAEGKTVITDYYGTRDHTERMLQYLGAKFTADKTPAGTVCSIEGGRAFDYQSDLSIPGDFSSAAFFIVGALIVPGSEITIRDVGINPTRTGLLDVLKKMGANIKIGKTNPDSYCEPTADITASFSHLKGVGVVEGDIIPRMIDEFPIFCIAAAAAEGETEIRGAKELRVKESDRIATMKMALWKIGFDADDLPDGIKITGKENWKILGDGKCDTQNDHRVAMAMKIAQLRTNGDILFSDETCIDTSFPSFNMILERICR